MTRATRSSTDTSSSGLEIDRDQIRRFAWRDRSDFVGKIEQLGGIDRRCLDRFARRHPCFDHVAELTCVLSVGPHAHIRAERDPRAGLVRAGEGLLDLRPDDHRLLDLRRGQHAVTLRHLQHGDAGNDRRHMKSAFGEEQLERASVEEAPVLDQVDPRFERRIDAGSAVRMSSDAPAQAMGGVDDRADFVIGELLVESSLDVGEHPARCHELDRVRAVADLAAHRAAAFVHTVANSRC